MINVRSVQVDGKKWCANEPLSAGGPAGIAERIEIEKM